MIKGMPKWPVQRPSVDRKKVFRRMKRAEKASTRHAHKFLVKRLDSMRNARRHITLWLVLVGVLIAATGLQLVWSQQSYKTTATDEGGTYAEALTGPIDTLNPLYAATEPELAASRLIFSSLYAYDRAGKLRGDLADAVQVDGSGKIYTVTLRSGAYWHDGTPLTAKDVAFTVNLIKKPAALSPLRINWQDVEVKAVNDTAVEFQLPAAYAAFPYALTFAVLPAHILGSVPAGAIRENTFSRNPVGSGPFAFQSLQSVGSSGHKIIQMSAFDKYYEGGPTVGRFEIHAYPSGDQAAKSLLSSEVNAVSGVPVSSVAQLQKEGYSISRHPVASGVYALFNVIRPNLKDKAVRQALQVGTNTEALRKNLDVSLPRQDLPFVNGQLTGNDVPSAPAPDSAKAAALLDQAGWKLSGGVRQKGEEKLSLTITTTTDDQYEKIAADLASQWRILGITVAVNVIDTDQPGANFVQNVLQPRSYDVLVYELLIGADPDVYAYWHSSQVGSSGYNFSNYSNPTADAALVTARSRAEADLRNAKYKTFARQWLSDVPAIGLYQPVVIYAVKRSVVSLDNSMPFVTSADHYATVLDWSVRQRTVYKTP